MITKMGNFAISQTNEQCRWCGNASLDDVLIGGVCGRCLSALDILQRIYDSEINLRIGWLWDGGVDYSIGTTTADIFDPAQVCPVCSTGKRNLADAIIEIADAVSDIYYNSEFAGWWILNRSVYCRTK